MTGSQWGFNVNVEIVESGQTYADALKKAVLTGDRIVDEIAGGEAVVVVRPTGALLYEGIPAGAAFCEGCVGHIHPGIRWPTASNDDQSHQWVERCDDCGRYDTDEEAAEHIKESYEGTGTPYITGLQLPAGSTRLTPFFDLTDLKQQDDEPTDGDPCSTCGAGAGDSCRLPVNENCRHPVVEGKRT